MDISVIIVNWNTKNLLYDCLASVYKTLAGLSFEIIVVDNASTDGSVAMLQTQYPRVRVIANSENKGFGAANNQGFAQMQGRYALLLNTDAVLTEGAAQKLFMFAEHHPDAAIVCGQLLNADGSKQNSVAAFPTLLTLAANMSLLEYLFPRRYPSKRYAHREPVEAESAIGACMLIRKKALDEVAFFDERYFFFFEETDLAYAMRQAGWRIWHVPDAFIYHLQGQSIGRNANARIEFYRSRYQFLRKWRSRVYYRLARGLIVVRLMVNTFLTLSAVLLTLGRLTDLREKAGVYLKLIQWHAGEQKDL